MRFTSRLHLARSLSLWIVVSILTPFWGMAYGAASPLTRSQEIQLIESGNPEMLEILGQRLIDPPHWQAGVTKGIWPASDSWETEQPTVTDKRPHYLGYGQPTFEHWKDTTLYVLRESTRFPTIDDYRKLHSLVFYNSPGDMFWGYYSQQIWDSEKNKIKQYELYKTLNRAQTSQEALQKLFSLGIKNGRGELRNYADTSWSGKPWDKKNNRAELYSPEEFERFSKQPYLRPSIKATFPEGIEGSFGHPKGEEVPRLLKELFDSTEKKATALKNQRTLISEEKYRTAVIELGADFYIRLLLIHGFWDGVGRTSKQMRDWYLRYMDVQVPADTPVDDMEYPKEVYAKQLTESIRRTELALKKIQDKYVPNPGLTDKTPVLRGSCQKVFN